MYDSEEFEEQGLYYILVSCNPNYCLSVLNNRVEPYVPMNLSIFNDSFYQAFYFFKNEDNSYYIMNINSLKIIGVENNKNDSRIIQNIISPINIITLKKTSFSQSFSIVIQVFFHII